MYKKLLAKCERSVYILENLYPKGESMPSKSVSEYQEDISHLMVLGERIIEKYPMFCHFSFSLGKRPYLKLFDRKEYKEEYLYYEKCTDSNKAIKDRKPYLLSVESMKNLMDALLSDEYDDYGRKN